MKFHASWTDFMKTQHSAAAPLSPHLYTPLLTTSLHALAHGVWKLQLASPSWSQGTVICDSKARESIISSYR